ncbi:Retrovirus-related Pol polyprotein from transposon opus, partial [Trichinella sp. T9]
LRDAGIRLNREKCVFVSNRVEFLRYRIDTEGIHPSEKKVEAIHKAPRPRNKQELQSFMDLLNFYHNFLVNKAEAAEPLHRLLDKAQYDDQLPLILTCDASPHGVECVLAHRLPCGREAPIALHSRTLAAAERKYSQIDREILAIIVGVKKIDGPEWARPPEILNMLLNMETCFEHMEVNFRAARIDAER